MNSDIDYLKMQWQSLNTSASGNRNDADAPDFSNVLKNGAVSSAARVKRIYTMILVICLIWTVLSLANFVFPVVPELVGGLMAAFFLLMSGMLAATVRRAGMIDFGRMSVADAMKSVCRLESLIMWRRIIGIPLAFLLLSVMIWHFSGNAFMIGGALCGAAAGLAIGVALARRIRESIREMKHLIKELER